MGAPEDASLMERDLLRDMVAREASAWFKGVFVHAEQLVHAIHRAHPDLRVALEYRLDASRPTVSLRERQHRGSVLVVLLAEANPARLELRRFTGPSKETIALHFAVVGGRLFAGVGAHLDPAGVAQRAVRTLVESCRPHMSPHQAAEIVDMAASPLTPTPQGAKR
jgi:hypothetical protein